MVRLDVQRLVDIIGACVGLIALAPVFLLIGVAVRIESHGPAFHRAIRVGRKGRLFTLYKFRTMVAGAERVGPAITTATDRRITGIGRVLRQAKLDELPQFLNVLKGEMSLVGPRPEDPRYVSHYSEYQRRVLDVRPGMTGVASLAFRHEEGLLADSNAEDYYLHTLLPQKLKMELDYVSKRSLASDMYLLLRTCVALVTDRRGNQGT